jgi:branched-chain amino acid transport system ATP-binding protein
LLSVNSLSVSYHKIRALWDVSVGADRGEIVSIIGANGAGKSTLLKAVMGLVKVHGGEVLFENQQVTDRPPHEIVTKGVSYVPEGRRLFPEMTVEDNLRLGAPRRCSDIEERKGIVYDLFPAFKQRRTQTVGALSGGEQQMVAIGRAMMARPKMILMDEPSFGLSPVAFERVIEAIQEINSKGVTIMLAEQNTQSALEISDRTYVLGDGRIVRSGKSSELLNDPMVKAAYMGDTG